MKQWLLVIGVLFLVSPLGLLAHPVMVDGDPSDWIGVAPGTVDTYLTDEGEGIWTDASDDDLGDGGDAPYSSDNPGAYTYPTDAQYQGTEADIIEWRVTPDPMKEKMNFLVTLKGFEVDSIPGVAILVDLDHVDNSGGRDFPGDADLMLFPTNAWEYAIFLFNNQIAVYDSSWNDVTGSSSVVFSTANNVIEAGVDVSSWSIDPFTGDNYFTVGAGLNSGGSFVEVDSLESATNGGGGIGPGGTFPDVDPDIYDLCFVPSEDQDADLNQYVDMVNILSIVRSTSVQKVVMPDLVTIPDLLINEFVSTPTSDEAIEIYNPSPWTYDLEGFKVIVTGSSFEDTLSIVAGVTISPDSYVVVSDSNLDGDLGLPNEGAMIKLLTPDFELIDDVGYGSMGSAPAPIYEWSAARSPNGVDTDVDAADFNMDPTPTMGDQNDAPSANLGNTGLVINEVKTASSASGDPFIELINTAANAVDISDWMILVDDDYTVPSGTIIDSGAFFVLSLGEFPEYFDMDDEGDNLYLFNASGERVDQMGWWTYVPGDSSLSVRPDGVRGAFDGYDLATSPDFVLADPTPGDSNGVPYVVDVFFDDFESGLENWTGDWDLQESDTAYSPTHAYTDSPFAKPPHNSTLIGQISSGLDLSSFLNAFLDFYYVHWLEQGFDYAYFDVSPDGGNSWITLKTYNGRVTDWTLEHIDISGFVYSTNFKFRWRLVTDPAVEETGMFVDDVHVVGYNIDISPPLITHTPPADSESIEGDFTAVATIYDASGISSDSLFYSFDGGPYVSVTHDYVVGDDYYFTIPAQEAGTYVSYFFKATDASDSLFTTVSDTFSYYSGRILYFDDGDPDYYAFFNTGEMAAVRFSPPPDSQVKVAVLMYKFYTEPGIELDSVEVHIWDLGADSLPGSDLLTPFKAWPANTPDQPQAWTYVVVKDQGVETYEDFCVGVAFLHDNSTLMMDALVYNRSYIYQASAWSPAAYDLFIRCIVGVEPKGVAEKRAEKPSYFSFDKPFPNPSRYSVSLRYALPKTSRVKIAVYDKTGRIVRILMDEKREPGYGQLTWDGRDKRGKIVPQGVYFVRFEADGFKRTHKVTLLR